MVERAASLRLPELTYLGILIRNDELRPVPLDVAPPAGRRSPFSRARLTLNDFPGLRTRLRPRLRPLDLTVSGWIEQLIQADRASGDRDLVVLGRPAA